MSTIRRTLVAVPVALVAVGLFAATSRDEWSAFAEAETDAEIVTDEDGEAAGEVVVSIEPGAQADVYDLQVRLLGEDVRRSLRVEDVGAVPEVEDLHRRVRDAPNFWRTVPQDCEEFDPDATVEDTDGSGDADRRVVWPDACTVRIPLVFEGRSERADTVRVRAELGDWDHVEAEGMVLSVDYLDARED